MNIAKFYQVFDGLLSKFVAERAQMHYENKFQVGILTRDKDLTVLLDRTLWTYKSLSFLPHATEFDQYLELQPIYITTTEHFPNNPNVIICTECIPTKQYSNIDVIFSSDNEKINEIRAYYAKLQNMQYVIEYNKILLQ